MILEGSTPPVSMETPLVYSECLPRPCLVLCLTYMGVYKIKSTMRFEPVCCRPGWCSGGVFAEVLVSCLS